jgi:hypothetical protein
MKLEYSLKVYTKDWRLARVVVADTKAHSTLEKLIRLPSKVALETFQSLSFPVKATDFVLVEKVMNVKLNPKRDYYVIEAARKG